MIKCKKYCAAILCAAMIMSMTACGSEEVLQSSSANDTTATAETEKQLEDTVEEAAEVKSGSGEFDKEETVYLMADADGKVNETIVSDWLKNKNRTEKLEDTSGLKDIENVKGDETFTQTGENVIWDAKGADIYYQGNSDKEAPVEVKVTYFLDGKEIQAKDLAGKSGNVKIRFNYVNKSKVGDVYTPFTMITGMILNGDKFTNIEVENGKVVSDGKNSIVIGYGMPGLEKSLDLGSVAIDDEKIDVDIPESFEVSADVKDFSLDMTMTIATTELFKDVDTKKFDVAEIFDKVDDAIGKFEDGGEALKEGTKKYTNGVSALAKGLTAVKNGTATLAKSTKTLKKGTKTLDKGAKNLNKGASTLETGIKSAKSGSSQLVAGFEGEAGAVKGSQALASGLSQLNDAVKDFSLPAIKMTGLSDAEKQKMAAELKAQLEKEVPAELKKYVEQNPALATDAAGQAAYAAAYQKAYAEAYEQGMNEGAKKVVSTVGATVKAYEPTINTMKSSISQLATGSAKLSAGMSQLYTGTKTLDGGLLELQTGSGKLTKGTKTLKKGTKQLDDGAKKLDAGVETLNGGVIKLYNGAQTLDKNSPELLNGTKKLLDGIKELKDKSNDYETDLTSVSDRAKAVVKAGKNYNSFGGSKEGTKSSCKFIIKTGKIAKDE